MEPGRDDLDGDARAIGRRALIKRAAVVGAAAWTAPVIVGSMASPAAAASCVATKLPITYSTAGTFTFTPGIGVTSIMVTLIGGGGGGGGAFFGSGGGGGGGGSQRATIPVTPCKAYTVVVGAGGGSDSNGLASTFGSPAVLTANGGRAGGAGTPGFGAGGAGGTGLFAGGAGAAGGFDTNASHGGGAAGSSGNGQSGALGGAGGAGSPAGGAGGAAGADGIAPGGGGGGGVFIATGGSGAAGLVQIAKV